MMMDMTPKHRTVLKTVQDDFARALRHQRALELAKLEGRLQGLSFATQENARRFSLLRGLKRRLQGGYYTNLDWELLREYARVTESNKTLKVGFAEPVTLRGIGLRPDGVPIYWYARADRVEPEILPVEHGTVGVLKSLLWAVKERLHEIYARPNNGTNPFPTTWGLMEIVHQPKWGPTLVEGRPTKDGKAFDYAMWPAETFFKERAA
jgi:hypothetical protein